MGLFSRKKESDSTITPKSKLQIYKVQNREGLEDNLKKCEICNKDSTLVIVDEGKEKTFVSCEKHKYEVYLKTGIVSSIEDAKTLLDVHEDFGFN